MEKLTREQDMIQSMKRKFTSKEFKKDLREIIDQIEQHKKDVKEKEKQKKLNTSIPLL